MDYETQRKILRDLPKGARVEFTGPSIYDDKILEKKVVSTNSFGYKIRMSRARDKQDYMVVQIGSPPTLWTIPWYQLSCSIIEVAERLNGKR